MTSPKGETPHAREAAQRERSLRTLTENAQELDEHHCQTVQAGASVRQSDAIDQALNVKCRAGAEQEQQ